MLTSTLPKTRGEAAALSRVRQMTDLVWTPLRDIPAYIGKEERYVVLEAGVPLKGILYSSTEDTDSFVEENISLESFLSMVENPDSQLYREGHGVYFRANCGMVCNGLVRYAFGISHRVPTALWFEMPGMRLIAPAGAYTAREIRLCDVLHVYDEDRKHVAMITDLLRDEAGEVAEIEVSEAVPPCCKRARYTLEEYFQKFSRFSLCRYDFLETVPPFEEKACSAPDWEGRKRPNLAVDRGNFSNYRLGEEVVLSVFSDRDDTVELFCGDRLVQSFLVGPRALFPLKLERGYYTARLKENKASVEFAVVGAKVSHRVEGDLLVVSADSCDENSRLLQADFRKKKKRAALMAAFLELSSEELQTGCFFRPIPPNAVYFKLYFENRYGIWTSSLVEITPDESV
ncbi:MAG: hypothetical protein IKD31_06060 [Clostridia bacterium]|nr:hypothetical protein [Clostridia bacterium]